MQIRIAATPVRFDGQGDILDLWRRAENITQQNAPQVIHPANEITKRNDCVSLPPIQEFLVSLFTTDWKDLARAP
jgi:hypothetical protein